MLFTLASCKQVKTSDTFAAMNTYITVQVYARTARQGEEACAAAKAELAALETLLSTTIAESDTYKLNHAGGAPTAVHQCVYDVLDFSLQMHERTGGLFNPALYPLIRAWGFTTGDYRVPSEAERTELLSHSDCTQVRINAADSAALPYTVQLLPDMQLDFGGIAKGYAGDCALARLSALGITSALVNLGGNVQTLGTKPDGSPWTVGITNPWGGEAVCAVKIAGKAVVTSGGYERFFEDDDGTRYIHIFDARTGLPADSGLESVTVIAERGMYADALSTSLFVMGKDAAVSFWKAAQDFDCILITSEGELLYSAGIANALSVQFPFASVTEIR